MLSLFDELQVAAHSCVIQVPDGARLDRLPEIFTEMGLAHLHVDNILALRASDVPTRAAASKQPPPTEAEIDDELFPDEVDIDGTYPHVYGNLPDEAAKELANLIMGAVLDVIEIGREWPRQYALDMILAYANRSASDEEKKVLETVFKTWLNFQGRQAAIQEGIQSGAAQRAGESWGKELLDALDSVHREFNTSPIDPTTSTEAARDGLRMELARPKRFVKLADRLYEAYRQLAYAYIVPEGKPPAQSAPATPTTATQPAKRGRLMVKERMEATLIKKPDALRWTITQWEAELKCSRAAIQKTDIWKRLHRRTLSRR